MVKIAIILMLTIAPLAESQSINQWDMRRWESLSDDEQVMFISGLLLGTWVFARAYEESTTREELADKKEYFQQILDYNAVSIVRMLAEENASFSSLLWQTIYKLPSGKFTPSARGTHF